MMARILILANSSSGLYGFRRELMQAFLSRGIEVSASNPDQDYNLELHELGCKTITTEMERRGMNPVHDFILLLKYKRLLKKEKPDLVITYTIKPNIYGGIACRFARIPYAINITGLGTAFEKDGIIKKLVITLYKVALKRAKVVFFENKTNRQIFVDLGIISKEKTKVLNGAGVNLGFFQYIDYPSDEKLFKFLFIGRLMKEKGVDELFSSMCRLIDEGANCSLMVLGRYEEGYEKQVKQYQEAGWLEYYGYQLDVRPFIAKSHCFVLPSYHEGMANTNLECAASGRPIITSNIPGCKEAVIENKTGLLFEPRNTESLYQTMKSIMGLSWTERKQMGVLGREYMNKTFNKRKVVEETIMSLL